MTIRKIVYLNKDNVVIAAFNFNDEDPIDQPFLAGLDSGAKWFEIDHSAPANFGWKYDGQNLIDPDGKVWTN